MKNEAKLIIIRGPSGSGKSTIAKILKDKSQRPTVLISPDQFRRMFNDQGKVSSEPSRTMVKHGILTGLKYGLDVIVEGILGGNDKPMLGEILQNHPEGSYIFYLDISYRETLRRHQMRPEKSEFGEKEMQEWWGYASPTVHKKEVIVPEISSLEETVALIQRKAGI